MSDLKQHVKPGFFEEWQFHDDDETLLEAMHGVARKNAALVVNQFLADAKLIIEGNSGRTLMCLAAGDFDPDGGIDGAVEVELMPAILDAVEYDELCEGDESSFRERLILELEELLRELRSGQPAAEQKPNHESA